jgi:hypothetical protein
LAKCITWDNELEQASFSSLNQEQDTEIGDRSDIDHAISEINQEKGIDMINWISSFNDISSW